MNRARTLQVLLLGLLALVGAGVAGAAPAGTPGEGLHLAYIDPGSGSFLIQALVATLAGIAVALRTYWHKVRELLGLQVQVEDDDPNE